MRFQFKFLLGSIVALAASAVGAEATAAPVGWPVEITAYTDVEAEVSPFVSTLEMCEFGTVVNGNARAHFTPWGGTFIGDKEFTCDGENAGFTIRLKARFGPDGSTGTWTLASAWGDLEGLKGSGSLVGIPSDTGIDDIYTGTVR
jgi:hypothetical protein